MQPSAAKHQSHLSSHLGPRARSVVRAGSSEPLQTSLTLARNANVELVIEAVRRLGCEVRRYLPEALLLSVVANARVLDDLARTSGVRTVEIQRSGSGR